MTRRSHPYKNMGEENCKPWEPLLQWPKAENELGLFKEPKKGRCLCWIWKGEILVRSQGIWQCTSIVRSISVGAEDNTSAMVGSIEWEQQREKWSHILMGHSVMPQSMDFVFRNIRCKRTCRVVLGFFHARRKPSWEFEVYNLEVASVPWVPSDAMISGHKEETTESLSCIFIPG